MPDVLRVVGRPLLRARCWLFGHSPAAWSMWRDTGGFVFTRTRTCSVCGIEETEVDG